MSSRRVNFYNSKGGYHNRRNGSRSGLTNKDSRSQQRGHQPQWPAALPLEQQNNDRNETHPLQLLRRVFDDKDDSLFTKRIADVSQLVDLLELARTTHSDSLEFRQEQMQLLNLCIHEEGLQRLVEFSKAPSSLKAVLLKLVSGLACYTRLDLALSWLFDRLSVWQSLEYKNSVSNTVDRNIREKELEWKKWLLRLLMQILTDSSTDRYTHRQMMEMSPVVLTSIISFLDAMDTADYLPLVIDLLTYFSENHSDLFAEKFKDIIDLLVGWNMDPQIPDSKKAIIISSYTSFGRYWNEHLSFAVELLTYFLNDTQSVLQELKTIAVGQEEYIVRWKACKNLLVCFNIILGIVLPYFACTEKCSLDRQLVDIALEKLLTGMLSVLYTAQDLEPEVSWLQMSKDILLSLMSTHTPVYRPHQYQLFCCLFVSSISRFFVNNEQAFLEALLKFLELWDHDIDENIVYHLLDFETSPILQINRRHDTSTHQAQLLLAILRYLLRVSFSERTQQQLTNRYLSELQRNFMCLSKTIEVEDEPMDRNLFVKTGSLIDIGELLSAMEASRYNTGSFNEMDKEPVSLQHAIRNTLFLYYMLFDMAIVWPNVRSDVSVALVKWFCIAYINGWIKLYIPCFKLLKEFWFRMDFMTEDKDGTSIILALLGDFTDGNWSNLNIHIRRLICHMIQSMLSSLTEDTQFQQSTHMDFFEPILDGLLNASATENNVDIKVQILAILSHFNRNFASAYVSESVLRVIERSICDPNQQIRSACIDSMCSLNPFVLASIYNVDDRSFNFIQRVIMSTPHTGSFRPVHYEIVARHLGMSQYLVSAGEKQQQDMEVSAPVSKENNLEWIRRLFHHCNTIGNTQNTPVSEYSKVRNQNSFSEIVNSNAQLLSFWAIWESARYCILSRLRTPFGGPQQTFAAFEHMLQSLTGSIQSKGDSDFRVRKVSLERLLLLLDRLELQFFNAMDGCVTGVLPTVTKSSLIFFRTNKKTCQDYFARIRPSMIAGAKIIGNKHFLIYHTTKMLTNLEHKLLSSNNYNSLLKEISVYLRDLVEACIDEKCSDYIYGLQTWFENLIKKAYQMFPGLKESWTIEGLFEPHRGIAINDSMKVNVSWFKVAALFASGHEEMAVDLLSTLTQQYKGNDQIGLLTMLTKKSIGYYASVEDYDALQQSITGPAAPKSALNSFLIEAIRQFCDTADSDKKASSRDYQASLASFDEFISSSPSLQEITQFTSLDKVKQCIFALSPSSSERVAKLLSENITSLFMNNLALTDLSASILELQVLSTDNIVGKLKQNARDWMETEFSEIGHLPNNCSTKQWSRLCGAFSNTCIEQPKRHGVAEVNDPIVMQSWGYMQLFTAIIARKQGNIKLADRLIKESINVPDTKYQSLLEKSKILFTQSEYIEAMKEANSVLCQVQSMAGYEDLRKKTLLEIAFYLKCCSQQQPDALNDMLQQLTAISSTIEEQKSANEMISSVDRTIEYALTQSINDNEQEGKPWFEYGTYHYKQAWRILDDLSRMGYNATAVVKWAREKLEGLLNRYDSELQSSGSSSAVHGAFAFLIKHSLLFENTDPANLSLIKEELHNAVPGSIRARAEDVVAVLKAVHDTIVNNFHASTVAYFRYLTITTKKQKDSSDELTSMAITAALRLLRILNKYGEVLRPLFLECVEAVQIKQWKLVVPQLFAQLNHHSSFVQCIVTKIILRICKEYPSDVIYDVIVNSVSNKTKDSTKQCLFTIASRMMQKNQTLWTATSRMVEELERITVLAEEKWMNKIASMQFEVAQQFSTLANEMRRMEKDCIDSVGTLDTLSVDDQETAFMALYHNLMDPLASAMNDFLTEMKSEAISSTPHEKIFWKTYGKSLLQAQSLLEKPGSMKDYRKGWECYQQIYRRIMADTGKVRVLDLSAISPQLSKLTDTSICMPGLSRSDEDENGCFVRSFDSSVIVLPTKTKPKKLSLNGTDGQKYSYLFKGLEDLHLDERIMQLLTTTNGLLKENRTTALRGMRVRTYAVIPISDHSGMIQWVNDSTPLFSIYKKWQKREMTAYNFMNNGDDRNDAMVRMLQQRPTDNYVSKVAAVLKASGLKVSANRRHWPLEVLKTVHMELVKETPGHLLENELYYSSSNATEWFKKTASFARSLAVTSMIGYIIGLGDRHLDNILIDFQAGELIHIDYNVCFEKGLLLRVPELVPYRLTQNLHNALGIAGTEGQFRTAAEETLKVLRKHKEVLVTLLEAFVYDPLVDWENEVAHGDGKRRMADLQANIAALATRISEKEDEYELMRSTIMISICELVSKLSQWQESKLLKDESLLVDGADGEENDGNIDMSVKNEVYEAYGANESDVYQGHVPVYLLSETKDRLKDVYKLLKLSSSTEGIAPLLESVTIIETEADNEMRPAQNYAKQALAALKDAEEELKKLDNQLIIGTDQNSGYNYTQMMAIIKGVQASVENYFTVIKAIEEFGPINTSSNAAVSVELNANSNTKSEHFTPSAVKSASNKHAVKIVKRIRAKLEGLDFGVKHRMGVSEQVTKTIEQATSIDNLSLMYEGWTSWV